VALASVALAQTGADPGTAPADVAAQNLAPAKAEVAQFADHAWCVSQVVTGARWPVRTDGVEALMAAGAWPKDALDSDNGDTPGANPLPSINGKAWQRVDTPKGVIPGGAFAGGYARVVMRRDHAGPVLLRAQGHSMVYINGEPYAGDPYGYGYLVVPAKLRAGANELLFAGGRGDVKYLIEEVDAGVSIVLEDATLPDAIGTEPLWIGVTVVNTTDKTINSSPEQRVTLKATAATMESVDSMPIGSIEAMSARKVGVRLPALSEETRVEGGALEVRVEVGPDQGEAYDVATLSLRVPAPRATRILTYISNVDGSVQKYAVVPAAKDLSISDAVPKPAPGLVLSLHGASVEATNQANAYEAKKDFVIVAPTNRRPFGFDWEDWGRRDALDVLAHAQRLFKTDPTRVYVTGHSMGGHGTWQMVSLFPDMFAAAAPSAGWESFESYAGWMPKLESETAGAQVANIFRRAAATCQTALLKENLRDKPLWILHGDADDNVPVSQARMMRDLLTGIASPIEYHEQPGAGHWWDDDKGPGAACLDWPGFFEMFRAHTLANSDDIPHVSFTTLDPGVSSRRNWITITQQERVGEPSTIDAKHDGNTITVRTENVAAFEVTLAGFEGSVIVDGDELRGSGFVRRADAEGATPRWHAGFVPATERSATRSGPFKRAFDRQAVLVYGTQGTPSENAWARAKALFDAQTFAYRGNGGFEVMSDVAYLEALALPTKPDAMNHIWAMSERNVILYGNRDTHALWARYVPDNAPLDVARGKVTARSTAGESRVIDGDGLVCVAVVPGPGKTLAGLVAPTGSAGGVAANRLPFFLSGAGFPDYMVLDAKMLSDGPGRGTGGVIGAGFFDRAWQIPSFADEDAYWETPAAPTPSSPAP
jgi:dienelactone hydrolase